VLNAWGFATQRMEVDERGRQIRWEHFDVDGAPIARVEGNHALAVTFDAQGFVASRAFWAWTERPPASSRATPPSSWSMTSAATSSRAPSWTSERARWSFSPATRAGKAGTTGTPWCSRRYSGSTARLSAATRQGYSEHRLEYDAGGIAAPRALPGRRGPRGQPQPGPIASGRLARGARRPARLPPASIDCRSFAEAVSRKAGQARWNRGQGNDRQTA
jgi:hypothetical protein